MAIYLETPQWYCQFAYRYFHTFLWLIISHVIFILPLLVLCWHLPTFPAGGTNTLSDAIIEKFEIYKNSSY